MKIAPRRVTVFYHSERKLLNVGTYLEAATGEHGDDDASESDVLPGWIIVLNSSKG